MIFWSIKESNISQSLKVAILIAVAFCLLFTFLLFWRYWRINLYDDIIRNAAKQYSVEPELVKAVIWQESFFKASCVGKRGEIGLMQITESAARDWAIANRQNLPSRIQLFDPSNNIYIGTWYISRALNYWTNKSSSLPYALAEYNAGRSNVLKWASNDLNDANVFWQNISYPSTKQYVKNVMKHYTRLSKFKK